MEDPYTSPTSQSPEASANAPTRSPSSGSGGKKSQGGNPHAPQRIRRRNRLITSCLECRRRKLKCDKQHPCTNCSKFNRDCVFLAPALDPASQMKLAEIKEKMGSLERTIEQDVARRGAGGSRFGAEEQLPGLADVDSGDELATPDDERDLEPTPFATEDAAYFEDADNELMDLGVQLGKMRITERIGGFVRPKLSEELGEVLQAISGDDQGPPAGASASKNSKSFLNPGPEYVPPSSSFLFGPEVRRTSIVDFLPSQTAADKLLTQYWESVHPVARIVHRPTFERQYSVFWTDLTRGIEPPPSFQAMVLAALLSAVISMPDDAVTLDFGVSKFELIENFQKGTETALCRAHILRTTKLETLQAFVMYLIPMCRREISRAHSALTGTAIRLAECMGLHRDGALYGLPAVEIHVRRLIWYQLCFLDIRTCEATGPRPSIRREDFDTKFPLNVNDEDLESPFPPTVDADYWTDMTLPRLRFECNEMHRLIWNERPRLERKKTTLTAVLAKIQNFWVATEKKYLPMMTEKTQLQHFANHVYRVLTSRMHIMVLQRYASTKKRGMPERLRHILMSSGTTLLEHGIAIETTPALSKWSWYSGALHQYHVALLLLGELFAGPVPGLEDRIWRCIDYAFEPPAHLDRPAKTFLIMKELRDRLDAYRNLRRFRAPADMERLMSSPTRTPSGDDPLSPGDFARRPSNPASSATSRTTPGAASASEFSFVGVANGEALFAPPPAQGSTPSSSDQGSYSHPRENSIGSGGSPSEAMLDIDWNEWDRLFPPDFNSSDLTFADMSFHLPNYSTGF